MPSGIISLNLYIGGRLSLAVPARIVSDDPSGRRLWIARGTELWRVDLPHGVHLRDIPVDAEHPNGHRLIEGAWDRHEALIWQPAGRRHAVWALFDGQHFKRWYVNLEERRFGPDHIDVIDHELDIEVAPDLTWRWKDEAAFQAKVDAPGYWSRSEADCIRAEGQAVVADIENSRGPFDGRWTGFRPNSDWTAPRRPATPALRQDCQPGRH